MRSYVFCFLYPITAPRETKKAHKNSCTGSPPIPGRNSQRSIGQVAAWCRAEMGGSDSSASYRFQHRARHVLIELKPLTCNLGSNLHVSTTCDGHVSQIILPRSDGASHQTKHTWIVYTRRWRTVHITHCRPELFALQAIHARYRALKIHFRLTEEAFQVLLFAREIKMINTKC